VLGGGLVELLALDLGDFELGGGRLPGAVGGSEGTGAPSGAAADLVDVAELGKGVGVTKRDVDDAMVSEGGHGGNGGGLLATAKSASGDEEAGELAVEATLGPQAASLIPEGLFTKPRVSAFPT